MGATSALWHFLCMCESATARGYIAHVTASVCVCVWAGVRVDACVCACVCVCMCLCWYWVGWGIGLSCNVSALVFVLSVCIYPLCIYTCVDQRAGEDSFILLTGVKEKFLLTGVKEKFLLTGVKKFLLTGLQEKSDHYWPSDSEPKFYGDLQVVVLNETHLPDWTITEFRMCLVCAWDGYSQIQLLVSFL